MENDSNNKNTNDIDSNNESKQVNENVDSPPESAKNKAINIMEKFIGIVGEDNAKKVIEEGLLVTTQNDIQQIVQNVGDSIIDSIGGKETYEKITSGKVVVIDPNQFNNMKSSIQQSSAMLEQSGKTINELQSNLKEQRKLLKKFYQLEAATLANKQGLEAILSCFETNTGWPTIEIYTEHGWVRGSVNYNLHNSIMLAKAATQSDNLIVIEKHLGGLNSIIKQLNQDISDIQKSNKNQYNRCKNCGRIKIARQVCEQCGTPEVEPDTTTGDDDEE